MHKTYENATMVIAWLGLHPRRIQNGKIDEAKETSKWRNLLPEEVVTHQFLQRPYWYRVWILQELWVARRVLFLLGRQRIG